MSIQRDGQADRVSQYFYDALGRLERIVYPVSTKIEMLFQDDGGQNGWDLDGRLMHFRYEHNGALVRSFEFGYEQGGSFYWFLSDALGSVRDIVSGADGAVIQSYDYKENGEKTTVNGSGPQSAKTWIGGLSVNDDVGDSGLYLMGHRHYDPSLGRFLSQDPIGFVGGMNLYEYASSSPVTMLDALGLQTTSIMPATPEQEILQGFQKIGTGAVITQGIPLLIGPDDVVGGAVIASGVKDVARGTVRYALGRISGAVSAPQEDRRRRKDDEFFERYGCEDEAVASDAANQLLQRAGHPNG